MISGEQDNISQLQDRVTSMEKALAALGSYVLVGDKLPLDDYMNWHAEAPTAGPVQTQKQPLPLFPPIDPIPPTTVQPPPPPSDSGSALDVLTGSITNNSGITGQ